MLWERPSCGPRPSAAGTTTPPTVLSAPCRACSRLSCPLLCQKRPTPPRRLPKGTVSSPPWTPRARAAGSGHDLVTQARDLPAPTWQPPGPLSPASGWFGPRGADEEKGPSPEFEVRAPWVWAGPGRPQPSRLSLTLASRDSSPSATNKLLASLSSPELCTFSVQLTQWGSPGPGLSVLLAPHTCPAHPVTSLLTPTCTLETPKSIHPSAHSHPWTGTHQTLLSSSRPGPCHPQPLSHRPVPPPAISPHPPAPVGVTTPSLCPSSEARAPPSLCSLCHSLGPASPLSGRPPEASVPGGPGCCGLCLWVCGHAHWGTCCPHFPGPPAFPAPPRAPAGSAPANPGPSRSARGLPRTTC